MDALIIKIDSNGTELWNMTAGGDGNQVVYSMQQTADGGLIFAGSMRNLDSEGHMAAMLMKVGKKGGKSGTLNATIGNMNGTSSPSPATDLTTIQTSTENVPAEKAAGYEAVLALTILLAVYASWRKRR